MLIYSWQSPRVAAIIIHRVVSLGQMHWGVCISEREVVMCVFLLCVKESLVAVQLEK